MIVTSMCQASFGAPVRSPTFGLAGYRRSRGRRQPRATIAQSIVGVTAESERSDAGPTSSIRLAIASKTSFSPAHLKETLAPATGKTRFAFTAEHGAAGAQRQDDC